MQNKTPAAATTDTKDATDMGCFCYVITMESFEGVLLAKPLGKSEHQHNALRFMEYVATREYLGRDPEPSDGALVFYDYTVGLKEPNEEYLRWMERDEVEDLNNDIKGGICVAGIIHVHDIKRNTRDNQRRVKRRYTIHKTYPVIFDLMEAETSGEQLFRHVKNTVPLCIEQDMKATQSHDMMDFDPYGGMTSKNVTPMGCNVSEANQIIEESE